MAHLNWKSEPLSLTVAPHAQRQTQLTLTMGLPQAESLRDLLAPVLADPLQELKLELPEGWTIFFKQRDGDSRALLAHPEKDAWVATIALSAEAARTFLNDLTQPGAQRIDGLSRVSNLELEIIKK